MPTKAELEAQVAALEATLEEARTLIDEALHLENDESEGDEDDD